MPQAKVWYWIRDQGHQRTLAQRARRGVLEVTTPDEHRHREQQLQQRKVAPDADPVSGAERHVGPRQVGLAKPLRAILERRIPAVGSPVQHLRCDRARAAAVEPVAGHLDRPEVDPIVRTTRGLG